MQKVMIGAPVRDRDWILQDYLDFIGELDYPWTHIDFCFVLNDSTDDSGLILEGFKMHHESCVKLFSQINESNIDRYPICKIVEFNQGAPKDQRVSATRQKIYSTLANVRNRLLDEFLKSDCDYLFSVDTDILVPPNALSHLIARDKDIIGAHIWNTSDKRYPNFMRYTDDERTKLRHVRDFEPGTMFEVDLTGAVYLIKREVVEAGARYGYHRQGEDIPFCKSAKDMGFEVWVDTSIHCEHFLSKEEYLRSKQ